MQKTGNILKQWLPLAAVTVALCGLVYLAVQQSYRMGANDPQIQLSEDGAAALAQGTSPEMVAPPTKIDIASSLAPFVVVFDDSGKVLASSGLLHGQNLPLPAGVLDYTRAHAEDPRHAPARARGAPCRCGQAR
jgi:hypothetical protein